MLVFLYLVLFVPKYRTIKGRARAYYLAFNRFTCQLFKSLKQCIFEGSEFCMNVTKVLRM